MVSSKVASRSARPAASASEVGPNARRPDSSASGRPSPQGEIGFIGLGRMGTAMASNLAAAGQQVIAYVRRAEQMDRLTALGLKPTTRINDLFGSELVISMLPNDDVVREVIVGQKTLGIEGLIAGLRPGAIHLSMSTISTTAAAEFASEHARRGQGYVAAPVFGNPDAAKARQLFVIAAGAPTNLERCRTIFDALGQQTFFVGDAPATANLIKLLGNALSAASLEILGELFALARKRGLDPQQLLAIFTGTMFDSRFHRNYGGKIAGEQYGPGGFVFPLALKDLRLALNEAEIAGVPMPSLGVVRDRLVTGIARGYAQLDWSALGLLASDEAGPAREPAKAD